jgi:hypothetical protein
MCEEKISSYVWKGVVHGKDVCKKAWKKFHDKTYGVLFQIVVLPKSTIGFVSNLTQLLFRKCRRFSPIFNIIGFVVRELCLPEVEGVCSGVHGRISMAKPLKFYFK